MFLDRLLPRHPDNAPETLAQELLKTVLMRTNFVPVLRHVIGWRGLKQVSGPVECWTAKIKGFDGVFGLSFYDANRISKWNRTRFLLHYFPHPDEELVEQCALQAAALTQSPEYFQWIRDFVSYPEFAALFALADILLDFDLDRKSLILGLEAQEKLRSISEPGISLERDKTLVSLVEPGGVDQNFPALDTASAFFDILAASMTFNLGQPPVLLKESTDPGFEIILTSQGRSRKVQSEKIRNHLLLLGYKEGSFDLCTAHGNKSQILHHWIPGRDMPQKYQDRLWWQAHTIQGSSTIDKKILGIDQRPPLIILTGFLGSGKTSFLKYFIEYQTQRSRFVAVIQNEIGSVGLDGKLLDYTVTEIDEGCVCCSLAGSLKRAVSSILASFDPDYVLVETTGLANPLNLLEEMEELSELVRFDSIVTVVDLPNALQTLSEHPVAAEQIQGADILMLNKKDLVSAQELSVVTRAIQQHNPHAPVFPTCNGELHPGLILDAEDMAPRDKKHKSPTLHHASHLQEGLWSQSVNLTGPVNKNDLISIVQDFPASIFRAKGVVEFTGSSRPMLFQYVGGRYEISLFPDQNRTERFLTVIGKGGDPKQAASAIAGLQAT